MIAGLKANAGAADVERPQCASCLVNRCHSRSGADTRWPELWALLASLQPGDVLVVWKLDRLSRSLSDLLLTLSKIDGASAGFRPLTEAITPRPPPVGHYADARGIRRVQARHDPRAHYAGFGDS